MGTPADEGKMPTAKEIYEKAVEMYMMQHPATTTIPTEQELKESNKWKKARNWLMKSKATKAEEQLQTYKHHNLEQYEKKLEEITSNFPSQTIPVDMNKIIPCPVLPPRSLGDVSALAYSIEKVGLLASLILRKSQTKPGFYEIVCGRRRFEALKREGIEKVEARVFDDLPDAFVFPYSAIENWYREPPSPVEKAVFLEKWKKTTGLTHEQIADFTLVTKQEISNYLRLLKLPSEVKELNAFNLMSLNMGLKLLKIKDQQKQIDIMKEFDGVLNENPQMTTSQKSKVLAEVMGKHLKTMSSKELEKMFIKDVRDMLKQHPSKVEQFGKYFVDACLKADLWEEYYDKALHYVWVVTGKKAVDVDIQINFERDKTVVDILSYREKDSEERVPFDGKMMFPSG